MSENEHADDHAGHYIVPPKFYIINAIVIAILMFLTIAASWIEMPGGINGWGYGVALFIAVLKAACIVGIFMGVKWNTPLVKVFALGVIGWLALLFLFPMIDLASTKWDLGTPYGDIGHQGENVLFLNADAEMHESAEEYEATGTEKEN
jgi:cytochrome c oxidase subunit 4